MVCVKNDFILYVLVLKIYANIQKHTKKQNKLNYFICFCTFEKKLVGMKTKNILFELIKDLDSFEGSGYELNYENFIDFINQNKLEKSTSNKIVFTNSEIEDLKVFNDNTKRDVTVLISFMFKYAKNYLKKALENSVINTPDEFAFLITMLRNKSLSKTELINLMVTEKTSGTETIKRLLKKELLEEIKLIDNKKSVHVKITDKGIQTISDVMPLIDKVTKIISGNLTDEELNFLSSILKKLDVFHNEIYFDKNTTTLDQIYDKVSIAN